MPNTFKKKKLVLGVKLGIIRSHENIEYCSQHSILNSLIFTAVGVDVGF